MPVRSALSYLKLVGRIPASFEDAALLRSPGNGEPLGLFFFYENETERRAVEQRALTVALRLANLTKESVIASAWAGREALETMWVATPEGVRRVRETSGFRFADEQ